jgi:hypothetical protein
MTTRRALLTAGAALALAPVAAARAPLRVLYVTETNGFVHAPVKRENGALSLSELALAEIGRESGAFVLESTQKVADVTPERLKSIDVLAFYTCDPLIMPAATWMAIREWVRSGEGAFVGLHSATDTEIPYDGPGETYTAFINGVFDSHPWTMGTPVRIVGHDPRHPTSAMWGASVDYKEEIYQYAQFDPAKVRVLQSLDFEGTPLKRPYAVPVTWVRQIGRGRLFYTNLGHTPATWSDPRFRKQVLQGILWAARRIDGTAEPNPLVQAQWQVRALVAYEAADRSPAEVAQRLARKPKTLLALAPRIDQLRVSMPRGKDPDLAKVAAWDASRRALLAEVLAAAG